MEKHLRNIGILELYKMPAPPTDPIPHGQSINTFQGVQRVLGDMRTFKTVYGNAMRDLTDGYGFFLAFDEPAMHGPARKLVAKALWEGGRMEAWVKMYEIKARELIDVRSWPLAGVGRRRAGLDCTKYVDVVRDVLNVVPVHWICKEIVSAFWLREGIGLTDVFLFPFVGRYPSQDERESERHPYRAGGLPVHRRRLHVRRYLDLVHFALVAD
jgi:hypothetical protein